MAMLKGQSWVFDRRSFMTKSALGAVGVTAFASASTLFAADDMCKPDTVPTDPQLFNSTDSLFYWIDGIHLNEQSNLPSRANLSLFMNIQQKPDNYVERVVLTDENYVTMGSRFFDASDKLSTGHVPYVMFSNLELKYDKIYYIFYQVRKGSDVKIYKFTLTNARRSVLSADFLPQIMKDDFSLYMGSNPGLLTSPLQFYTRNTIQLHSARSKIINIGSDNSFEIQVELMHGDATPTHYMRYFIVTDPVGRLLGVVKKNYQQTPDVAAGSTTAGSMIVRAMSDADRQNVWQITANDVAKINDCPYIQIFTEDVYDALARSTVHLR